MPARRSVTCQVISPGYGRSGNSLVPLKLRVRLTPYLLLVLLTLGTGLGIGLGMSAAGATTEHSPRTVQGHGTFGTCSPARIVDTVSINHDLLSPGDSLIVRLTAKNLGNRDCQYDGGVNAAGTASIGPCGAVPLVILNSNGKDVWPGSRPYFCPFSVLRTLHAGETIHARGQWDLVGANEVPVRPGKYTVDVALRVRLSIVVG